MKRLPGIILGLSCAVTSAAQAESSFETADASREAYSRINPKATSEQLSEAFRGRSVFRQSWVIAPAQAIETAGLGPLYNQLSCLSRPRAIPMTRTYKKANGYSMRSVVPPAIRRF